MTEAAALSAAIATASAYILAGDPVDVACRDAAEDAGLNPKLIQNRLLAGIGATAETARDVLRASAAKAKAATQANAEADRATALAAQARAAAQVAAIRDFFRTTPEGRAAAAALRIR